ncbi:type III pantothenate kinase [Solimonas soli]|uniref:type III pantothenate kinase n=1 Tax=Solimonas soli TaxID=413479 RepID=UPI000480D337|nr:type III pantothenate kinase [Solimonas soli]
MKLLIDIGNTRLKWALARDGRFVDHGAVVHGGEPARVIAQLPAAAFDAVWVSHVTGAAHETALIDATRSRYGQAPRFARSTAEWHGLRNAYREPERLGVDRWLAMIAAWQAHRGAAVIANAGTALTVDVIAADGQHSGGIIAAGLAAQQRAVLGSTRFDVGAFGADEDAALGTDSQSCVRQGALLACRGAVEYVEALAPDDAIRWLTGGDAHVLAAGLHRKWRHEPQLVLDGLLVYAENAGTP